MWVFADSRGAHRPAGQRLAAAARRRQLGHHAGRRLGSGKIIGKAACASICCRASTIRPIGFVASANEELYRRDGPPLHAHGQPDYRKRRIVERLTELPRATIDDMQNCSTTCSACRPAICCRCCSRWWTTARSRKSSPRGTAATRRTSTEATLFQHFYRHVVLQIFGNEQGIGWRRMFYLCTRMGYSTMVLTAIDRTLRKVTSSWWRGRSKKALVQRRPSWPSASRSNRGRSSTRSTS